MTPTPTGQQPPLEVAGISCACFNLRRAARLVTQLYDAALQPSGLRCTQFSLLVGIQVNEPVSLSALAARLGMDRTTLTRNLEPLASQGLIRTRRARDDRRSREVVLTAVGRRKLNSVLPLWEGVQRSLLERLGKREWGELYGLLGRTISAVHALSEGD